MSDNPHTPYLDASTVAPGNLCSGDLARSWLLVSPYTHHTAPFGVLSEVESGGVPGSHSGRLHSRLLPATSSTAPAPAAFPPHAAASQRRVFGAVLAGGRDGTTRSGRDAWAWRASVGWVGCLRAPLVEKAGRELGLVKGFRDGG